MPQSIHRELTFETQMGYLPSGMDTSISATSTMDLNFKTEKPLQGLFHDLLNGDGIDLPLPTRIALTAIRQDQRVDHRPPNRKIPTKGSQTRAWIHGNKGTSQNCGT